MPKPAVSIVRAGLLVALAVVSLLAAAPGAGAGTYTIQACDTDVGFSSPAFGGYANRGMKTKQACGSDGAGLRGLVTGNVVRSGRVRRGAQSRFVLDAPAGTRFLYLDWSGKARRRDCRYTLQLYAWRPDGAPKAIRNYRANRNCPKQEAPQVAQVGIPRPVRFSIAGASRIVQRVVCMGGSGKRFCSARAQNLLTTYYAQATVLDLAAPTAAVVADNPLTQGAWVRGTQSVTYDASDNVGVKRAHALIAGRDRGRHDRPCEYTRPVPCNNGPGQISVDTTKVAEGTSELRAQAIDAADNAGVSGPLTVRIDNTAPGAVPVAVDGGEAWRAQNSFAAGWQNPAELDRAPITAAHWRICRPDGSGCATGSEAGAGIGRLADLHVPDEGEWELRVVREDAAGNRDDSYASAPVRLRLDVSAPELAFESAASADPTRITVAVNDKISGVAGGQIELSREGTNVWQILPTQLEGGRLVARIDDAALPAGTYLLRSQAHDLAGNVGVAAATQAIILPLRIQPAMQAGVATAKTVRRKVGKGKKRRRVRRKLTVLRPSARVGYGEHVTIRGRLTSRDGQPLPGLAVQVLGPGADGEQLLATLTTDAKGAYRYRAVGSASRMLRFVFPGSPLVLPAQTQVTLSVPAAGSFAPSRKRLANGGRLVFRGRVRSRPLPSLGKLIELQVKQPTGEWTTFRTVRSDARGRWALPYRFRRVSCHTSYRMRANIPAEAGYPFAPNHTRARTVLVRGAGGPCP